MTETTDSIRYRDKNDLLPVHHDLLQFFEEQRTMSLAAIGAATGYHERLTAMRVKDLEHKGYIKIDVYPRGWAKPNRYTLTRRGRKLRGLSGACSITLDLQPDQIKTLLRLVDGASECDQLRLKAVRRKLKTSLGSK